MSRTQRLVRPLRILLPKRIAPEKWRTYSRAVITVKQRPKMEPVQQQSSACGETAIKEEQKLEPVQQQSSVCGETAIKQEQVKADQLASPKQEIVCVLDKEIKEESLCLLEWEVPDDHTSTQDPLSIVKEECPSPEDFHANTANIVNIMKTEDEENEEDEEEGTSEENTQECSASEDFLGPRTFTTEKTKDKDDEDVIAIDDGEEVKHEVTSGSGSDPESSNPVGMEDDRSDVDSENLATSASVAGGTGNRIQDATKQEAFCEHKSGTRHQVNSCGLCKEIFAQLQHSKEHKHIIIYKRLISSRVCRVSHKTFPYISDVGKHFRVHTGKRPNTCAICNKAFTHKSYLKQHLRIHTGECPNSCVICNKAFTNKSYLKQHLRIHTGERPYSCRVCHMQFRWVSTLKHHSQLHTAVRPNDYHVCQKKF